LPLFGHLASLLDEEKIHEARVNKKLTGAEVESIQGFIKPGTEATSS